MKLCSLLLMAVAVSVVTSCGGDREKIAAASALTGGDPKRGELAIRKYGCYTCHTIPGIEGADAVVGPPLNRMGSRNYVRHLPNTPENLIRWIRHPKQVFSQTPMPDTGVTEQDGRDIAAYLYTLR